MAETRRRFDAEFREGAVRIVRETGKPIAQVAWELGINADTLGNWVGMDRRRRESGGDGVVSESERAELKDLGWRVRPSPRSCASRGWWPAVSGGAGG